MKKNYESPKAEKMTFDYNDVVVASGKCKQHTVFDDDYVAVGYCQAITSQDTTENH